MIEKITHNWVWKVVSLFLAFILWLVVVNYDDPYITKAFDDIPVEKKFEEAITSQDKAITYLQGETIDVVLGGNRSIIDKLKAVDIVAYVDMNLLSITGAIDIEVGVNDKIDVLEKTPNNMQISLEQIDTELKDIQIFYDGELAEDYIKINPILTPNQIELTGPESKLAIVASVLVNVKIDGASDDITVYVSPKIQDSDGNDIPGLEMSIDQVQVNVPIEKTRTISVNYSTIGAVSEDYRLMSISLDVDKVNVRGEALLIDEYQRLVITDLNLSTITDKVESLPINLSQYLPEGIQLYGSETIAYILLDVEPIESKDYGIMATDITVKSLDEQMQFRFMDELNIPIVVKGIPSDLADLSIDDFFPSISLKDLEAGEHEVALDLTVNDRFEVIGDLPTILVELTEAVLVDDENVDDLEAVPNN